MCLVLRGFGFSSCVAWGSSFSFRVQGKGSGVDSG